MSNADLDLSHREKIIADNAFRAGLTMHRANAELEHENANLRGMLRDLHSCIRAEPRMNEKSVPVSLRGGHETRAIYAAVSGWLEAHP